MKKHFVIGLPIIATSLMGTFALTFILQTKFDYQDKKQHMIEKDEILGIDAKRERFDIRKAYFVISH